MYYSDNIHCQKHFDKKFTEQYQKYGYGCHKDKSHEIMITKKVLSANDIVADDLRTKLIKHKVFVLNMMSSPGSGKTSVLEKTLSIVMEYLECAVIVGDICTTNDADRLAKSGAMVVQINTGEFGGDCHLTASAVGKAMENINLNKTELLIVENIGNLVCPAEFDIGEDSKVVLLSVTEGEDKPAKYPLMFRNCEIALLNKIDLLPYLDFDKELAKNTIRSIKSDMPIFEISAKTKEGFDDWIDWLKNKVISKLKTLA